MASTFGLEIAYKYVYTVKSMILIHKTFNIKIKIKQMLFPPIKKRAKCISELKYR